MGGPGFRSTQTRPGSDKLEIANLEVVYNDVL